MTRGDCTAKFKINNFTYFVIRFDLYFYIDIDNYQPLKLPSQILFSNYQSIQVLEQENTRYRSKSLQLENTEQSHRIQYENLKRKVNRFFRFSNNIPDDPFICLYIFCFSNNKENYIFFFFYLFSMISFIRMSQSCFHNKDTPSLIFSVIAMY